MSTEGEMLMNDSKAARASAVIASSLASSRETVHRSDASRSSPHKATMNDDIIYVHLRDCSFGR